MNLGKLQEIVRDREAWHSAVNGLQRVRYDWVTKKQQETSLKWLPPVSVSPGLVPVAFVSLEIISRSLIESDYFQITAPRLGFRACETLCVLFNNRVSISYNALHLSKVSPAGIQSQAFSNFIFLVQDPWPASLMWHYSWFWERIFSVLVIHLRVWILTKLCFHPSLSFLLYYFSFIYICNLQVIFINSFWVKKKKGRTLVLVMSNSLQPHEL